jgi:hypothetical protein
MLTPLSLLCGSQLFAGKWRFHTALSREKHALDRYYIYLASLFACKMSSAGTKQNLTKCSLQIVHKKTSSVLCLTTVKNEDKLEFSKILEAIKVESG